jgi:hypothetical protein
MFSYISAQKIHNASNSIITQKIQKKIAQLSIALRYSKLDWIQLLLSSSAVLDLKFQ